MLCLWSLFVADSSSLLLFKVRVALPDFKFQLSTVYRSLLFLLSSSASSKTMKKSCCSSCFPCFSGSNNPSANVDVDTPNPSATQNPSSAVVHINSASSAVATETVATRQDPQTPPSKFDAQVKKRIEPSLSSSSSAVPAVAIKHDDVVPPPPSGGVSSFTVPSPPPYGASSSTVPEAATSSSSSCVNSAVVMATHNIHHSQQSTAYSSSQADACVDDKAGEGSSSSLHAAALEGDDVDVDLDGFIEDISQRLKLIEEGKLKSSQTKGDRQYWLPASKTVSKLKEILSEGINVVTDVVRVVGSAHLVTAGLVAIAIILERLEDVDANKTGCLRLLKEMIFLAKVVKQFKERPQLKEGMHDLIKEATQLIVEGSTKCCKQIDSSKFSRFFTASVNKEDLDNFRQEIDTMYRKINSQMGISIFDANTRIKEAPLSRRYPSHAVGIDEPVKEIIDLLDWGTENPAIAIMLHGFGGTGKTTLADAVFSLVDIQGCKYSTVRLFQNIDSTPNIIKLQRSILEDLMEPGETVPKFTKHEDGQRELGRLLEKVPAFIYIDNVLGQDELGQLLPNDFDKSKKVRLLLTARDATVRGVYKMETKVYDMEGLSDTDAIHLLKREIYDSTQIDSTQLKKLVQSYGGIPKLLEVVGRFIRAEGDKQKAYGILMKEKEKWDTEIGKIESYLFAYDHLPGMLKDPFLDICSFFKGWNWDTVADIVGETELDMLKSRALVTNDTNGVVIVHDVILSLGQRKTKGTRFTFNNAMEFKQLLDKKEISEIKGIMLSENNKDLLDISASKLDLMNNSLRVLALGNFIKVHDKCNKTFEKLIYIQGAIPYLPFDVSKSMGLRYLKYEPKDLNFLEMPSSLRHMEFDGRLHSHAFEISSRDLQQLGNLRILRLTNFAELKKLPEDLGDLLNGLRELTLSFCKSVEELPGSISKIQSLRVIRMDYCSSLRELPEDFGLLSSLEELNLQGSSNLKALSNGFEKLTALRLLNVSFCQSLLDLPHGLGNLTSLAALGLKNCSQLRSIPESIGQMKSLAFEMNMSGCSGLKELPNGFCNLSFITKLSLANCSNLEKLPDRFGDLVSLRYLSLTKCTSLKKFPDGFGQLKYLKDLRLGGCQILEELSDDFHCLESLEYLILDGSHSLKRLHEYFHCLPSLQVLTLSDCPMLDGKWMDTVVKIKPLQTVSIMGSEMLLKRWGEIQREGIDPSWSFAVHTGEDLSKDERENIEKQLLSELDCLLSNSQGEPFHVSDHLRADSVLLVIFDGSDSIDICNEDFPWPLFEETNDEIQTKFEMIYLGDNFNKLPAKVQGKIVGHGNRAVLDFEDQEEGPFTYFQIVGEEKGAEYAPRWKFWTSRDVEEFLLGNCRSYQRLKQLAETSGESNIELLRELFATRKGQTSHIFQKNDASQKVSNEYSKPFTCGVEELKGKRIFLDIRPIDMCYDIRLGSLIGLYNTEKESFNLEVISIPLLQPDTDLRFDLFEQFSGDVPWLVLRNPGMITRVVKYFLIKGCLPEQGSELWDEEDGIMYMSIVTIIEPNGKLFTPNKPVLPLLDRWGSKAYPFTPAKIKELKEEEETHMQRMFISEFFCKHLDSISYQVKEIMLQQKMMIFLFGGIGSHGGMWMKEFTCLRNALIELSDSIHIIFIPRFNFKGIQRSKLTETTSVAYFPLENVDMPQGEMEGMPLLNLSQHDAIRFRTCLRLLRKEMDEVDVSDTELGGMTKLLYHLNDRAPWMTLIDKDGKMVTQNGIKIELLCRSSKETKAKELMQLLIKGSQEERQQALFELEHMGE